MLDTSKFAAALIKFRGNKISQAELGRMTGIHRINILRYEQGEIPHVNNFYILCQQMRIPMKNFFTK